MDADQFRDSDDEPNRAGDNAQRGEPEPDKRPAESVDSGEADPAEQAEPRTRQEHADRLPARGEEPRLDTDSADPDLKERARPDEARRQAPERTEGQPAQRPEWQQEQARAADSSAESGVQPSSTEDPAKEPAEPEDKNATPGEKEEIRNQKAELDFEAGNLDPVDGPGIGDKGPRNDLDGDDTARYRDVDGNLAEQSSDQPEPLTDEEWAEHLTEVRDGLAEAESLGLRSECLHTINGSGEVWTDGRDLLHYSILESMYSKASDIPCDFKAIIAGGLGGAGKTTILTEYADIDLTQYLMINPDNFKEEMARRKMVPEIEGLSPMEATDLVHEESSYLALQLALRAQADGKNVIWDITMSSESSTARRIDGLREAGYSQIEGLFVDIPVDLSIERTESRHREDHEKYRAGEGLGGRYVPPEVSRRQEDQEWCSKNRKAFSSLRDRFDGWSIYDNSVDGRRATLIDSSRRRHTR